MNIKTMIKYQLNKDVKKPLAAFYGIIFIVLTIMKISSVIGSVSIMEYLSMGFLFVLGLNSFKNNFKFYQANAVSRKEQHMGFIILVLIVSLVMAIIDNSYGFIFSAHDSVFYNLFAPYHYNGISLYCLSVLWSFCMHVMFFTIGYFITLFYYTVRKTTKIVGSIGLSIIVIGYAAMEYCYKFGYQHNNFGDSYNRFGHWRQLVITFNCSSYGPYTSIICALLVTLILTVITNSMIKKVALKK